MATQTIEFEAINGLTGLTLKAFQQYSDTLQESVTPVAATNRTGCYVGTFTDLPESVYRFELSDSGGLIGVKDQKVTDTTATFRAYDSYSAGGVSGTVDANIVSTQITAQQITAGIISGSITQPRGDTWAITITGLGTLTGYENIWFSGKPEFDVLDSAAWVQIDTDTGLKIIMQETGTPANGSISVDDAAAGTITVNLAAIESAKLPILNGVFDIQIQKSGGAIDTLTQGKLTITGDVTRAVS